MLKDRIRMGLFLAQRPAYYPELLRRVRIDIARRLTPRPIGRARAVAEAWCSERAVTLEQALDRLNAAPGQPLEILFPETLAEADRQRARCPVTMGGGGGVDLLYHVAEAIGAKTVLETGVAYGYSSLALLLSLRKRRGRLYSVDMPYIDRDNGPFVGCVVPDELRPSWNLYRFPDYVGLPRALADAAVLDLCHYDSDKSYEGRVWAYCRLWAHLRTGGVFLTDDAGDNTAFRDFSLEVDQEPVVIRTTGGGGAGERFVGMLVKS